MKHSWTLCCTVTKFGNLLLVRQYSTSIQYLLELLLRIIYNLLLLNFYFKFKSQNTDSWIFFLFWWLMIQDEWKSLHRHASNIYLSNSNTNVHIMMVKHSLLFDFYYIICFTNFCSFYFFFFHNLMLAFNSKGIILRFLLLFQFFFVSFDGLDVISNGTNPSIVSAELRLALITLEILLERFDWFFDWFFFFSFFVCKWRINLNCIHLTPTDVCLTDHRYQNHMD